MKRALVCGAGGFIGSHLVSWNNPYPQKAELGAKLALQKGLEKTYEWIAQQVREMNG